MSDIGDLLAEPEAYFNDFVTPILQQPIRVAEKIQQGKSLLTFNKGIV